MLNTGWGQWDKFLYNFVGKKINIIEIGAYEGEATSWFLKNLMSHKESVIYAIDTFEGSPEYIDTDFSIIKKTFFKNIQNTKRDNQVIVMQMMSFTALNKLIYEKKMINQFDIIFIDASHEANDVIIDAVLSWNLLKIGGVLIFDDYKWKKIIQKNYRPALAIDSFIEIYKPEIEVLNIGWQFILKKIKKDDSDLPIVTENIYNEVNELYNNYFEKFYNFKIVKLKSHNNKIKFNIKFDVIENLYSSKNISNYLNTILDDKKKDINENMEYVLPSFFIHINSNVDRLYKNKNSNKKLKFKEYIDKNENSKFSKYYNFFYDKLFFVCYSENLSNLLIKNESNNITFLNFDYRNYDNASKTEKLMRDKYYLTNEIFKNKSFLFYNIFINQNTNDIKSKLNDKFENFKNIKMNQLHFYYFNDIISLSKKLHKQIDLINISLNTFTDYIIRPKILTCLIFYYCFFVISIQKIGGNAIITIPIFNDKLIYDIIYIFCKYYNNIELKINFCKTMMTSSFLLFLSDFKGISDSELDELLNMCNLINSKISDTGININFMNKKLREELKIEKKLNNKSSNITISNIHDNVIDNLYLKSLNEFVREKYSIFNLEIKLLKRVLKILEELEKSEFKEKFYTKIDNLIFKKQLEFLTIFYGKIFT